MNNLRRDLTDCRVLVKDNPGREFHCVSGRGCRPIFPGHDIRGRWDGAVLMSIIDSRDILSVVEEQDANEIEAVPGVPLAILEQEGVPVIIDDSVNQAGSDDSVNQAGSDDSVNQAGSDASLPGFMAGQGGGDSGGAGASDRWDQPAAQDSAGSAEPESTPEFAEAASGQEPADSEPDSEPDSDSDTDTDSSDTSPDSE